MGHYHPRREGAGAREWGVRGQVGKIGNISNYTMDKDLELKVNRLREKWKANPDMRPLILKQVELIKAAQEYRNKRRPLKLV